MTHQTFLAHVRLPVSADEAFDWHARPGALARLVPPWEPVEIVQPSGGIEEGARAVLRLGVGPVGVRWVAEHRGYRPKRQFQDVQIAGPFALWRHTHTIEPDGPDACRLEDRIDYRLPAGPPGRWLAGRMTRRRLERMFAYRHRTTADDLLAHARYRERGPMNVLISGRTGLIGSALDAFLTTGGHRTAGLTRRPSPGPGMIHWDWAGGELRATDLHGFDAVVHLAGENLAAGRWTAAQKARIRDSRVQGTRRLCEALAALERPPGVLIAASAIGYYGDRGDELLTEVSAPGRGFLAEVCQEWEAATLPARDKGIRVVNLRIGVVLSAKGGALPKMLTPFRLGAGGRIGSGRQYWSWVALEDVVGAIHHGLMTDALSGPVNAVSPQPVTNREFTRTLGEVLHRPTLLPLPKFAARLALGREMADEMLLSSTRVVPRRLQESGYPFRHPTLRDALRHELGH